ncbi:M20/M25/M40 family metallo-hydrolase [Oceanicoccus sp. KOV_DT_Chl]|uniref:M20/M25/M40 family metallo-hydrolase n=1 Tax=Oceanicoccus sp. KOV_DT_Chl TaxID=1904639 RepID=UPI000C7A96A4|nr:M20/M25/M40 family metallo-hydrolase [Oceanicoccus sp. KOV_DT_Chl]
MKSINLPLIASLVFFAEFLTASPLSPAVGHLAQAIRYQTVSYQDTSTIDYSVFSAFHQFLRDTYPTTFSRLQVEVVGDYSLLLSWPGTQAELKPVLLDAHYDVVPVEPGTETDWTQLPFAGVIADGYIWGRGALDDKSAVIATLEAIEALLASGYQPQRSLLFSIVHDEEIGGNEGAAKVAAHLKARGVTLQYMVGEGGMVVTQSPLLPNKPLAMVSLAEKTYVTLTLKTSGAGGHSSRPVADNAIIHLSQAVTRLHEAPFAPELIAPVSDMLAVLGEEIDGVKGFLMRNQWFSAPLLAYGMGKDSASQGMVRNTTAVTMFNAGIKENVIPQQAEAKVNFRLLPGFTPAQLIAAVKTIIDDPAIEISASDWKTNPPVADINGPGYQRIKAAINSVLPNALVTPGLLTASTDTPHYVGLTENIYRFHPFTVQMEDSSSVHGTNERIAIEAMVTAVALSKALISEVGRR